MRADFAMLELFDIQSTSDQEDYRLYPSIAAAAPVQMLPEQAGNWAYPQSWMSPEQIAYTMVTGLRGRLYLSGFLNQMEPDQLSLVGNACRVFKAVRADIAHSVPGSPAGLPEWFGSSQVLRLTSPHRSLLCVWHRGDATAEIDLDLGDGITAERLIEIYPNTLHTWDTTDAGPGVVRLRPGTAGPSARLFEIRPD